jgi:hypothetical protein
MARALSGEGASRVANGVLRALLRGPSPAAPARTPRRSRRSSPTRRFSSSAGSRASESTGLAGSWPPTTSGEDSSPGDRGGRIAPLTRKLAAEGVETRPIPFADNGLEVVSAIPAHARIRSRDYRVADAGPRSSSCPRVRSCRSRRCPAERASAIFRGGSRVIAADGSRAPDLLRRNRARLSLDGVQPVAADIPRPPLAEGAFAACSSTLHAPERAPCARTRKLLPPLPGGDRRDAANEQRLSARRSVWFAAGVSALFDLQPESEEVNRSPRDSSGIVPTSARRRSTPRVRSPATCGAASSAFSDQGSDGSRPSLPAAGRPRRAASRAFSPAIRFIKSRAPRDFLEGGTMAGKRDHRGDSRRNPDGAGVRRAPTTRS